jgi:hypothetical protein
MRKSSRPVERWPQRYERLRQSLAHIGYISQGSVVDRARLRPPRSGYQWTRKVKGKTITVALSAEEFAAFDQAIQNERQLRKTLREMEQISRRVLFKNRPQNGKRKRLSNKVLGVS